MLEDCLQVRLVCWEQAACLAWSHQNHSTMTDSVLTRSVAISWFLSALFENDEGGSAGWRLLTVGRDLLRPLSLVVSWLPWLCKYRSGCPTHFPTASWQCLRIEKFDLKFTATIGSFISQLDFLPSDCWVRARSRSMSVYVYHLERCSHANLKLLLHQSNLLVFPIPLGTLSFLISALVGLVCCWWMLCEFNAA